MSQQERIKESRKKGSRASRTAETAIRAAGTTHQDVEQKLNAVDAAFDDYLATAGASATGPGVVVGEQQAHQVVRPLSDEALVQGFRQTSGE